MRPITPRARGRAASFMVGASLLAAACGGSTTTTSADTSADTGISTAESSSDASADAGNPLLTGSIGTVSGNQFDMASLEGQDAVLWFWAPW